MDDITTKISDLMHEASRAGVRADQCSSVAAAVILAEAINQLASRVETGLADMTTRLEEIRDKLNGLPLP